MRTNHHYQAYTMNKKSLINYALFTLCFISCTQVLAGTLTIFNHTGDYVTFQKVQIGKGTCSSTLGNNGIVWPLHMATISAQTLKTFCAPDTNKCVLRFWSGKICNGTIKTGMTIHPDNDADESVSIG